MAGIIDSIMASLRPSSSAIRYTPPEESTDLTPEEEESLFNRGLSALEYVGDTLSKGGRAARGVLSGLSGGEWGGGLLNLIPFSDTFGITDPKKQVYGRDLLELWGVADKNKPGLFNDWGDAVADVAGFGLDIITDPLTYVRVLPLTKVGKTLQKQNKSFDELSKLAKRQGDISGDISKIMERALGTAPTKKYTSAAEAAADLLGKIEPSKEATSGLASAASSSVFYGGRTTAARAADQIRRGERALLSMHLPFMEKALLEVGSQSPAAAKFLRAVGYSLPVRLWRGLFSPSVRGSVNKMSQILAHYREFYQNKELFRARTLFPSVINEVGALHSFYDEMLKSLAEKSPDLNPIQFEELSHIVAENGKTLDEIKRLLGDYRIRRTAVSEPTTGNVPLPSNPVNQRKATDPLVEIAASRKIKQDQYQQYRASLTNATVPQAVLRTGPDFIERFYAMIDTLCNHEDRLYEIARKLGMPAPLLEDSFVEHFGRVVNPEALKGKQRFQFMEARRNALRGVPGGAAAIQAISKDGILFGWMAKGTDDITKMPSSVHATLLERLYGRPRTVKKAEVIAKLGVNDGDDVITPLYWITKNPKTGLYEDKIRAVPDTLQTAADTWQFFYPDKPLPSPRELTAMTHIANQHLLPNLEAIHKAVGDLPFVERYIDAIAPKFTSDQAYNLIIQDIKTRLKTNPASITEADANTIHAILERQMYMKGYDLYKYFQSAPKATFKDGLYSTDIVANYAKYIGSMTDKILNVAAAHDLIYATNREKNMVFAPIERPYSGATFVPPEGYVPLAQAWKTARLPIGALERLGVKMFGNPKKVHQAYIPSNVSRALRNYVEINNNEAQRLVVNLYDKINSLYKGMLTTPWPAFHGRNMMASLWQSWAEGNVSLLGLAKGVWQAARHFAGKAPSTYINEMKAMNLLDDLRTGLADIAIVDKAPSNVKDVRNILDVFSPIKLSNLKQSATERGWARTLNPFGFRGVQQEESALAAIGSNAHRYVESLNRGGYYIALREAGYAPHAAAELVTRVHFDYSKLSAFERTYARRFVMFYGWLRNNIPLQLQRLLTQPGGRAAVLAKALGSQNKSEEYRPQFLRESFSMPLPGSKPEASHFVRQSGLPLEDLNIFTFSRYGLPTTRTLERALSRLTPLAVFPLEMMTGRAMMTGRSIKDLNSTTEDLGLTPRPWLDALLHYSPASRAVGELLSAIDTRKPLLMRLANAMTGLKVGTYDVEKLRLLDTKTMLEEELQSNPFVRQGTYFTVPQKYKGPQEIAVVPPPRKPRKQKGYSLPAVPQSVEYVPVDTTEAQEQIRRVRALSKLVQEVQKKRQTTPRPKETGLEWLPF